MDISITNGDFYKCENLVLHLHVSLSTETRTVRKYLATFHEGAPAFQTDKFVPLLVCVGKGHKEWQATLACLDMLLGYHYPKGIRPQMEKWLLSCQDSKACGYSIYLQVRHKGFLQDVRLHTVGLPEISEYFPNSYIAQLVPGTVPKKTWNKPPR